MIIRTRDEDILPLLSAIANVFKFSTTVHYAGKLILV